MNRKNLLSLRILGAVIVFSLFSFSIKETHYYVVIGAFAKEMNAQKFTGYARNLYLDARYQFNPTRNLYYVNVMETGRKDDARNWSLYLKHEKGFSDAWVYTSLPVETRGPSFTGSQDEDPSAPRYHGSSDLSLFASTDVASARGTENVVKYERGESAARFEAAWTTADDVSFLTGNNTMWEAAMKSVAVGNDVFTFQARTPDGRTLPAEIMLVDYKKARKVASFHTNQYVGLCGKKQNQSVTLVCDIFGYSVETKAVNLHNPGRARNVKQNSDGVWQVQFDLKPMKENEISILYNTTFYPNAAVLQPSSKKQVDQVLSLMKAHPSYKIVIHGHCNKGPRRELQLPGSGDLFFDISSAVTKSGSDKQLTKERAATIKAYLVANGIDDKRIDIFGWGSLDNLVSPNSADTTINDRIEVELVHG
jgi:outer membrane protein OmpA-like peptidoglycan-associated protein